MWSGASIMESCDNRIPWCAEQPAVQMSETLAQVLRLITSGEVRVSERGYDELAEDGLGVSEILDGANTGVVVEDYPDFPKGRAVLVRQLDGAGRAIHVVWGIPRGHESPAVLVTAYRPDPNRWDARFLERRK